MTGAGIRVVKVGGSLLDFKGLGEAWSGWYASQPHVPTMIVAGGGPLADHVRRWDQLYQLGEEVCHWMCIQAMSTTATLVHQRLPGTCLARDWSQLEKRLRDAQGKVPVVFSVRSFLEEVEPCLPGTPLPHSWDVTSDSIAGRIAQILAATELVLCKSTSAGDGPVDWRRCATEGQVDRYFPKLAATLPCVRWVNLRATG